MKQVFSITALSLALPFTGHSKSPISHTFANPNMGKPQILVLDPKPIYVFEWGVNGYDWSKRERKLPILPDFIYTPKNPGVPLGELAQGGKIRDRAQNRTLYPDLYRVPFNGGIIFKPLLYVKTKSHKESIPLGVELRFEGGDAVAWWPQAHIWRKPEEAKPAKTPPQQPDKVKGFGDTYRPLTLPSPLSEDPRMELEWQWLNLTKKRPPQEQLKGLDLDSDHWIQQARDIDALWISNKTEAEKYLFYEGTTNDLPDISVVHTDGKVSDCQLLNTSCHAIHDVFIIYKKGDKRAVTYIPQLLPFYAQDAQGTHPKAIRNISLTDIITGAKKISNKDYIILTKDKLANALSPEKEVQNIFNRHLFIPQKHTSIVTTLYTPPPQFITKSTDSALTPDLAKSLATIWDKEFFHQEGLTIIYRESNQQLDQRIPMRFCTDAEHGIVFSRCGLVLNSNINLTEIKSAQATIDSHLATGNALTVEQTQQLLSQSQAMLAYLTYKSAIHPHMEKQIKKVKKMLSE